MQAYGILGGDTVYNWIRKYGHDGLLPKLTRIQTVNERDRLKEANKRIKQLQAALADSQIDNLLGDAFLEIACDKIGISVEELKKRRLPPHHPARPHSMDIVKKRHSAPPQETTKSPPSIILQDHRDRSTLKKMKKPIAQLPKPLIQSP